MGYKQRLVQPDKCINGPDFLEISSMKIQRLVVWRALQMMRMKNCLKYILEISMSPSK